MKISQKHIQWILLLLIVVIGVCAYQFGYVKYIEKANSVKEENKQIEARINELTDKETHREEWTKGIEQSEKDIKTILAKYGPGNTPEKSIMFVRRLEDAAQMQIPNISFNTDSVIYTSNEVDENGVPEIQMTSSYLGISYTTTYEGLKECMNYINSNYERMNVGNFTANFNQENGQLAGNMIINLYSVKDADHIYTDPVVSGVDIGTDNIFGTIDLTNLDAESTEPEGVQP
ncbi:MAG: hypothetical protein K6E85_13980 [Lachnospiraceae bacterium]|nr:hypothetical protein [Lachnospiraceae bacterium]